ncbi:hypothetical protein HTS88_08990 [Pseudarthrobacter oxydans]|uniref:hypothetical protein n=1 Tax=Pseudarthrobacter oxydans TaxID=1671 RepID=UPI0015726EA8|nr:hypothetical protein [Pseudarthrobacter oxydans]NSX36545.1 hypothetical protein [Pseudarthrobacter oxydans]
MITERTCGKTGLRLAAATAEIGFRVAKDRYGALSVLSNAIVGPLPITSTAAKATPDRRGRYDTLGSTIYLADSRRCAYAEVLVGFRKDRAAVAKVAESIGWPVDAYIAQVLEDARTNGVDAPWSVSVDWQMDRSIYEIQMPHSGWWARMDHPDTLNALEKLAPTVPGMTEVLQVLTAGSTSSEDRAVTTILAEIIRQQVLDDGSEPLGISFPSKTLFGRCWAYWDRRFDAGLPSGSNDLHQLSSQNVGPDPEFTYVTDYYELPLLGRHP